MRLAYLRLRAVTVFVWSGVRASLDFMNSVWSPARSAGVVFLSLSIWARAHWGPVTRAIAVTPSPKMSRRLIGPPSRTHHALQAAHSTAAVHEHILGRSVRRSRERPEARASCGSLSLGPGEGGEPHGTGSEAHGCGAARDALRRVRPRHRQPLRRMAPRGR